MTAPVTREPHQLGYIFDLKRHVLKDGASFPVREVEGGRDLAREGDLLKHCPLLLDGFGCCYALLEDGQRQIVALHLPGDLCNLPSLLLGRPSHGLGTLTPARVVFVPHVTILAWKGQHTGRTQALWQATMVEAAISRAWVVNVGRRTAYQRTAHLLCEFLLRMRRAGLAQGLTCRMPLTRQELGDALGLTAVHVSRALEWLRNEHLIDLGDGTLTVRHWPELTSLAGFDPAYLHGVGTAQ